MSTETSAPVLDPVVGLNLNGYIIEARIGEGGMGLVYSGVQEEIGKRVAIKVIKADIGESADIVQRLIAEARAVNAIRHRGIVDIFGSAKLPDGRQAIIMEYLEGHSLEDALATARSQGRTLPLVEVLQITDEVLSALSAAHRAGVIHRDLKPSNIFLCRSPTGERHVKLLDFGIAKMGVLQETKASVVLGTPSYMAPEQARGESVGPALDLYAMGVILFELVTGTLPFTGDNAVRVIYQHLEAPIPVPSARNPSLPGALDAIIVRLLAKRPHERHASAEELRRELGRLKVAVSDPSALTTIEEPIAAFDAREPLEQTFVKGRTPEPASLELNRTGVLDAPRPALAPAGPSTGELTKAVQPKRGPVLALGAAAVLLGAGATWLATRSPALPPTPAPAVVAPIPAAPVAEPSPVVAPAVPPPPTPTVAEPVVAPPSPTVTPPESPAAAVAQPNTEPAKPIERPKADDAKSGRERLQRQLKNLERSTAKAKAAGDDVQLVERQLSIVRTRLEVARSPEELEALQVALERIAEDLGAP